MIPHKYIYILVLIFLWSCNIFNTQTTENHTQSGTIAEPLVKSEKEKNAEIVKNKIETIRKRLALKWLIIDGDSYYRDGQLPLALKKYLDFYEQNKNDDLIKAKIWDTYFEMKKFSSAITYYDKIKNISIESSNKRTLALWYNTDLENPISRNELLWTLQNTYNGNEQGFYHTNSLECIKDFHRCKLLFWEYFWPEEISSEENGFEIVWEDVQDEPVISYDKLRHVKEAIENYRNFRLDDVILKNTYILWAYFSDEMYNLCIVLWKNILSERPDYKPVLKIIAQSYFELWRYEEARTALWEYYKIDDEDPAVTYMLGVVNTKLWDLVLSNIYLSKALSLWYESDTQIYRQLVHNYYKLENDEKIRSTFKDMLKFDDDYEAIDLSLAIYYHILDEDYATALAWSKVGQEKFQESGDFYGYEWWIYRERGDIEASLQILERWRELDDANPFIIINTAYSMLANDKIWAALILFKRVAADHPNTEFASIAESEIRAISEK